MNWTAEEIDWIDQHSNGVIAPATVVKLRSRVGMDRASQMLTLAGLQVRARRKFGPGVWMASEKAIEQASDRVVARYKSKWVGQSLILDLCCGVGGDAMEFARQQPLIAVDADPQVTCMLRRNLQTASVSNAAVVCDDAMTYAERLRSDWPRLIVHIDPDRRVGAVGRVTEPERYSPPLERLAPLFGYTVGCLAKLAPAATLPDCFAQRVHRQWISLDGSVREQTLMSESLAAIESLRPGMRSAVRVFRDGRVERFQPEGERYQALLTANEPLAYVFDLDPAIRAAGLSEACAAEQGWQILGQASGFFTSDALPNRWELVQVFSVLWSGPADTKTIKRELIRLERRLATVKVRGTDHDPARLLKQLSTPTNTTNPAITLLIGRSKVGVYAVLANEWSRTPAQTSPLA